MLSFAQMAHTQTVHAQTDASQPVHIVLPYAPGSTNEVLARLIAPELSKVLQVPVVVVHKPGAGGTIAAAFSAQVRPGVSTLLLTGSSHIYAGHLQPKLSYHPVHSFAPVALIGAAPYLLAVRSAAPDLNLSIWTQTVREHPMQLNYASAGNGSGSHIAMAGFLKSAGLQMQHIPMKSATEAVNELLAGRVQAVMLTPLQIRLLSQVSDISVLGITGAASAPLPADIESRVRTIAGFKFQSWAGFLAPHQTPAAEVERLHQAINLALQSPAVQAGLYSQGVQVVPSSIPKFSQVLANEWAISGDVIKALGVRQD